MPGATQKNPHPDPLPASRERGKKLDAPVQSLEGVGPTRAKVLRQLGVENLGDLLEYFPRYYQRESGEKPISDLVADQIQSARGEIVAVDYIASYPRPRFEATLDDGTGKLALVWFHGAYLRRILHPGMRIRVRGMVKIFRGLPQMSNPKQEAVDADIAPNVEVTFRPIYPATANLPSETIATIVWNNLDDAVEGIDEWFGDDLLNRRQLLPRRDAYRLIHKPLSMREAQNARRRLVYDEFMLLQLGLILSKRLREKRISAPVLRIDKLLDERILKRFPFQLTGAQQRSIWEIVKDLRSGQPMNRLLQGDVGSGKTVVALYAMLAAVANKMQAAILAPTEVLAEQHFLTLSRFLEGASVRIELLTGRTKRQSRGAIVKALSRGEVHIAVGTQALIQEDIDFANLGLVVVDEQHKLGVTQRGVLKDKSNLPHYLVMTATPIPRTLALSYFADFDLSVIDELPPGRKPIKTRWLKQHQSSAAYDFVREQVGKGHQAYVVFPQIEENGIDDVKSVKQEFERLSKGPLSGLRLAMLHGQLGTDEKHATMTAFRAGEIDALIATTVIEVGIDVPNATVMLIDSADRFGLSQLHQLRGRVGRGGSESHCILLSDAPTEDAEARLKAMTHTNDGFEIAEMDLKLRGPGEFFGTRQHGLPEFKIADLTSELELLQLAKEDALELLSKDPHVSATHHRALAEAIRKQFAGKLDYAQIG